MTRMAAAALFFGLVSPLYAGDDANSPSDQPDQPALADKASPEVGQDGSLPLAEREARLTTVEGSVYVHLHDHEEGQFIPAEKGAPVEAGDLVRTHVKPQLDDVVARFEAMRASGEVRADVDARQLCISTVAMACFPYTDEAFLDAVWSLDPQSPAFIEERKREIVRTVMARIAP